MNTCTRCTRRRAWRLIVAAWLAGGTAGVAIGPAGADPIGANTAEASALVVRATILGRKEAALSRQYYKAVLDAQSSAAKAQLASLALTATRADVEGARGFLQADALSAYMHSTSLAVVASRTADPVTAVDANIPATECVANVAATRADALDLSRGAVAVQQEAQSQVQAALLESKMAASHASTAIRAALAAESELQATLVTLNGDNPTVDASAEAAAAAQAAGASPPGTQPVVAVTPAAAGGDTANASSTTEAGTLEGTQRGPTGAVPVHDGAPVTSTSPAAPRTALAAAAPPATPPTTVSSNPPPTAPSAPPPVGSGAAVAVAAAESRLGLPYVYGAAGPSAFDCSGLVMWAWAHAGVSLPHNSGSQYASTTHISMSQLQPGDLVFPASPGQHVAMYIGGGQIIEAPYRGEVVHIVPLTSWYVLASRP